MSTAGQLNDAWYAYLTAIAGSDPAALGPTRDGLYAAAQAHAAGARSLGSITRYYVALINDPAAEYDDVEALAQELDAARRAAAVLDGAWPGTVPVVGTGG